MFDACSLYNIVRIYLKPHKYPKTTSKLSRIHSHLMSSSNSFKAQIHLHSKITLISISYLNTKKMNSTEIFVHVPETNTTQIEKLNSSFFARILTPEQDLEPQKAEHFWPDFFAQARISSLFRPGRTLRKRHFNA